MQTHCYTDYYAVLEVPPDADLATIKNAYRAKAIQTHPDRHQGEDPAKWHRAMQQLNEAFAILSDPQKRRRHDEARANLNNQASRQYNEADMAQAREQAQQYPRDFREFESWLDRLTREFTNIGSQPGRNGFAAAVVVGLLTFVVLSFFCTSESAGIFGEPIFDTNWPAIFFGTIIAAAIAYHFGSKPSKPPGAKSQGHAEPSTPRDKTNDNLVPGWYVGTCTNTTVGVSGNLLLVIHGVNNSGTYGELYLTGELAGGGTFHGKANEELVFSTCTPSDQTVIAWRAQVIQGQVSGTYSANTTRPELVAAGNSSQQGTWTCRLARHAGPPNPSGMEAVYVHDEGSTQGPFIRGEFDRLVGQGQWPSKAIVALEDSTVWGTVGDYLTTGSPGRRN